MSLTPGTRLGHYDVTTLLGEGGRSALSISFDRGVLARLHRAGR